jgi:hypothetical protein
MRKPVVILSLAAALAAVVPGDAPAQGPPNRGVRREIRQLQRQVAAHDARITDLEQQVEGLQTQVSEMSGRLNFAWEAVQSYYGAEVDCDAGESLSLALGQAPPTVPKVIIGIKGTCHEHIPIDRDGVSLYGMTADAAIEAPPGTPLAVFVTARDIRLDNLVIRAADATPGSGALRVLTGQLAGANLRFERGGISVLRNSTVELFGPVVIEGAGDLGIAVWEDSYAFVSNCEIHDSALTAVDVRSSAFATNNCLIERSGEVGIRARKSRLDLFMVEIVDSAETGVQAETGSSIQLSGGIGAGSRIAGSIVGLAVSGGSTVLLGESTIEENTDGVVLSDASVLQPDWPYTMRVTGNTGAGVRCAPTPAVPQLGGLSAGQVFGNGEDFVDCHLP